MKKILLCAAALIALYSCEEKENITPAEDKVSVAPDSKTFEDGAGGDFTVMVTSSGDWELTSEEDYSSWCTPSVTSGKDGETVTFNVAPEDIHRNYNATWTFTVGKATDDVTISFIGKELLPIEVVSGKAVSYDHNGGELKILLSTEVDYENIEETVTSGAEAWLEHVVTKESAEAGANVEIIYNVKSFEDLEDRNAVITLSAPDAVPAEVTVAQTARLRLETTELYYKLELAGGNVEIPVSANVAYEYKVSDGASWLTYVGKQDGKEVFSVGELASGSRSANIVFTQTDAEAGTDPMTFTVTVTQIETLIKWAADMTGARFYPLWDGTKPTGFGANFTLEALIYADELKTGDKMSAIMGNKDFLVSLKYDETHKVHYGSVYVGMTKYEFKSIYDYNGGYKADGAIEAKRWYHVAVTFAGTGGAKMYLYIDGKEVAYGSTNYPRSINFTSAPYGEKAGFYVGYHSVPENDFKGKVTEVRMWKKVLTETELNAEGHFYKVDPSSDGLVAYWPFTAGSGTDIADATAGGNKLYGETEIKMDGTSNVGTPGINWVSVALPDK